MSFKTNLSGITGKLVMSIAVVTLSALALPAHAAKFGVRVVDDNGAPVAGASVCIGLQGNYKRFGATFTDSQGQVMIDVPNVPLLVTVSKDRFTGVRSTEPARAYNLLKQVKLREGVPGPRCRAGSVLAESAPSVPKIVVSSIGIQAGPTTTTISPVVSGEPSHYRVSASKDFDGAKWQNFDNQIALNSKLSVSEKVFLQMRKRSGTAKAYLESVSDVMTVRLTN